MSSHDNSDTTNKNNRSNRNNDIDINATAQDRTPQPMHHHWPIGSGLQHHQQQEKEKGIVTAAAVIAMIDVKNQKEMHTNNRFAEGQKEEGRVTVYESASWPLPSEPPHNSNGESNTVGVAAASDEDDDGDGNDADATFSFGSYKTKPSGSDLAPKVAFRSAAVTPVAATGGATITPTTAPQPSPSPPPLDSKPEGGRYCVRRVSAATESEADRLLASLLYADKATTCSSAAAKDEITSARPTMTTATNHQHQHYQNHQKKSHPAAYCSPSRDGGGGCNGGGDLVVVATATVDNSVAHHRTAALRRVKKRDESSRGRDYTIPLPPPSSSAVGAAAPTANCNSGGTPEDQPSLLVVQPHPSLQNPFPVTTSRQQQQPPPSPPLLPASGGDKSRNAEVYQQPLVAHIDAPVVSGVTSQDIDGMNNSSPSHSTTCSAQHQSSQPLLSLDSPNSASEATTAAPACGGGDYFMSRSGIRVRL